MSEQHGHLLEMDEEDFNKTELEVDKDFAKFLEDPNEKMPENPLELNEETDLRVWLRALLFDRSLEHYKDVEFIVGNGAEQQIVKAHRLILATRSRTFADILDRELDSGEPIQISG